MSTGGYDAPHMPSNFSRYDSRRPSGNFSAPYDRASNSTTRRVSPSPGPSRRPYDSYVPPPRPDAFRDGGANNYRPNVYRPEQSSKYYSRSPTPDPYIPPSRTSDSDIWDRAPTWRPPFVDPPNIWPERKPVPPSPTTSARSRNSRDDPPNRLFEPSDSWKQTHHDRPPRVDHSPASDRFFGRRGRTDLDGPPDKPRIDRTPPFIPGGDRYRPAANKRESFPPPRSDSYRPQYENGWNPPSRREPISPASNTHHRRDSGPFTVSRISDRHGSPYANRPLIRKNASSPHTVTPARTPNWGINIDLDSWSTPPPMKRDGLPRAPSRSSIASTHVSDRESPVLNVTPLPLPSPPSVPADHPQQTLVQRKLEIRSSLPSRSVPENKPDAPKTSEPNGAPVQLAPEIPTEPTPEPKLVSPVKKQTLDVSIPAIEISHSPKQSLSIPTVDIPPGPASPIPISSFERLDSDTDVSSSVNGTPAPTIPEPEPMPLPAPAAKSPEAVAQVPSKPPSDELEVKQPKPSYLPTPVLSGEEAAMDFPPPTHSPSHDSLPSDSPIIAPSSPRAPTPPNALPTLDEIPPFSEAKTKADALRIVVMTRLLCDRQTREERIGPVLMANLSIAAPLEVHPTATPAILFEKMLTGQVMQERMDMFNKAKKALVNYVGQRQLMKDNKINQLREEYLSLQESWIEHCNALDEKQKSLASEQENQHTGRTTRRTAAITDAVRSDFEMEQIIASLGVDDATDPNHLSLRNLAKIPDMISVTNGKVDYLFDDTAHLVENPKEYFAPHTGIDDWTEAEKQTFLQKFGAHPKQFGIIADYLPNKTAAQCVDFYYLHKKRLIDFRKVVSQFAPNKRKRRGMGRKKGNGLLADIALHDLEVHRGSGAASPSPIVTRAPRGRKTMAPPEAKKPTSRRAAVQFEDTPTSTPTPEPESRTRRRKGVASGSATPAVSSAVATSVFPVALPIPVSPPAPVTPAPAPAQPVPSVPPSPPGPLVVQLTPPVPPTLVEEEPPEQSEPRPVKRRRTRKIKSAATVSDDPPSPGHDHQALPPSANDEPRSAKGRRDESASQWSQEDLNKFIGLVSRYGDNFKLIAASMPNKTTVQVTNFYNKNKREFDLDNLAKLAGTGSWHEGYPGSWLDGDITPTSAPRPRGSSPTPPPMSSLSFESNRSEPPSSSSIPGLGYPPPLSRTPNYQPRGHRQAQPPMARLGNLPPDSRRSSVYNNLPPRTPSYPYASPPEARGGYAGLPQKPNDLIAGRRSSDAARQQRPYLSTLFNPPLVPPPVPTPSNGRSNGNNNSNGNSNNTPATGPNVTPIIHSPTGMSPPALPPMQAVHPYFPPPHPNTASPHHNPYFPPSAPLLHHDPRAGGPLLGASWVPAPPPPQRYYGKMDGYGDRERRLRETRKREPNPYPVFDGAPTGSSSASSGVPRPPGGSSRQDRHYEWD
ncbi:hypothetical protein M413DRAFT_264893 [Hebeloma cylindrosporum]|uniref:SANT domain-containing protein n=1 Tax=Hebeloma cylindrosporum TaxID=76867 RepID=A0A0C3CSJ4_HEBCY|nr:hypothetical protein M413DRAFT_264893 [Hebeloma cylindrosporum h7]